MIKGEEYEIEEGEYKKLQEVLNRSDFSFIVHDETRACAPTSAAERFFGF